MNSRLAAAARATAVGVLGVLIALAAGCAWNRETVVLLPERNEPGGDAAAKGHAAVAVTKGEREIVLDRPYAAARQSWYAGSQSYVSSAEEVQAAFGPALAAQPKRAKSFVLYFVEGTDEFTPESKAIVDRVFAEIASYPVPDVVVVGHTDAVGSDRSNDALSQSRADTVAAALAARGIARENIHTEARGKRQLLVPTPDGVAEPANRRVEIVVR